jgi:hypothetical protein
MTTPQVWVSTTSPQIDYDGQTPGEHRELVGAINTSQESDFHTYIQVLLGLRQTPCGRPEFYLDGDPDSSWVQATDRKPFWVAIDPWGEMRPHIHGARPTYFVSSASCRHPFDSTGTRTSSRTDRETDQDSDSLETNERGSSYKMGADGRLTGICGGVYLRLSSDCYGAVRSLPPIAVAVFQVRHE